MKSYTVLVKTLSKHIIIVILHFFWVKHVVIEQNSFISENYWSFTEIRVMDTKNNSEKVSLIRSFFWILQVFDI